jgi:hypothetical protein
MITKAGIIIGKEINEGFTNYQVYGSPVIEGNYVSGLKPNNYIYIPVNVNTTTTKISVYIDGLQGETKSSSASVIDLINSTNSYPCRIYKNQYGGTDGYFNGAYGAPGGNTTMATTGTFRMEFSVLGTTASLNYYEDGVLKKSGNKTIAEGLGTVVKVRFGGEYTELSNKIDLTSIVIKAGEDVIYAFPSNKSSLSSYQITSTECYEI